MADRREFIDDPVEAVRTAFRGMQSEIWTALPGIIESFDPAKMTVRVQPAIKARVFSPSNESPLPGAVFDADNWWTVALPLLVDIPVVFPGGGGFTMTFPIQPGDECVLVFSARSIDNWWYQGGVQEQSLQVMHDLSDGFAFVGVRSQPRKLASVNTTNAELRNDSGTVKIELTTDTINVTAPHVNVNASTKAIVTSPAIELGNGGTLQALLAHPWVSWLLTHTHTSASPGSPTSAPLQAQPANSETTKVKAE